DLTLYTEDKQCDEETVCAHWRNFIQSFSDLSPAYKDLVYTQRPSVNNNKIMLTARNEAEASALKRRLDEAFRAYCQKVGMQTYTITVDVKTEESDMQKFREQRAKE